MMMNPRLLQVLQLLLLLLLSCHDCCLAFSTSEAHFTSVKSGTIGPSTSKTSNASSRGTASVSSSFFRLGIFQQQAHTTSTTSSDKDTSNSSSDDDDDERFCSEMLLIGFNVCSMLLILIRCYYHWAIWNNNRMHRGKDGLENLRQKAEQKLQDIEDQPVSYTHLTLPTICSV